MSLLFDKTLGRIQGGLNIRQKQQSVIAGNIANADTPGYRARRISFREALNRASGGEQVQMATTQGRHMTAAGGLDEQPATAMALTDAAHSVLPSGAAGVGGEDLGAETAVDDSEGRVDGNNVDLEKEMSDMAMNAVEFNALGSIARKKFGLLRYAVMNS
jgi:flagellar basal-body rod protein FlgB